MLLGGLQGACVLTARRHNHRSTLSLKPGWDSLISKADRSSSALQHGLTPVPLGRMHEEQGRSGGCRLTQPIRHFTGEPHSVALAGRD